MTSGDNYHLRRAIEARIKPATAITCEDVWTQVGSSTQFCTQIQMDVGDGKKLLSLLEGPALDEGRVSVIAEEREVAEQKRQAEIKGLLKELLLAQRDHRLDDYLADAAAFHGVTLP